MKHIDMKPALAGVMAAVALALSACGGGSSGPPVASGGSATSSAPSGGGSAGGSAYGKALAYARCIRAHGVPGFPDPSSGQQPAAAGADTGSPQFQAAERACRSLAPAGTAISSLTPAQQAQALADGLKFARCMRAHGLTTFPDPRRNSSGGYNLDLTGPGIDSHSPLYQRALQACRSDLPRKPAGGGS
jgi:hypothetical protein